MNHDVICPDKPEKYDTFKDIMMASVKKKTYDGHNKRYIVYMKFCDVWQSMGHYVPTITDMKNNKRIVELDNLMMSYLEYLWNQTHNLGNTLKGYVDSLIFMWQIDGVNVSRASFPWLRRFGSGCNRKAQDEHGKRVNNMKFAIVNPQLDIMYKTCINVHVKMAMLLQHRFLLRAEHYTTPPKQQPNDIAYHKDCLRMKHVEFIPHSGFAQKMKITLFKDKNHQIVEKMVRIVPCTCHLEWTCVVHEFLRYSRENKKFQGKNWREYPAIGSDKVDGSITYSKMNNVLQGYVNHYI